MSIIYINTIPSWIINKMAHRIKNHHTTEHDVVIRESGESVCGAINIYMDILGKYRRQKDGDPAGTHVGLFTHRDDWLNGFKYMDKWLSTNDQSLGWSRLDGIMVLCRRYYDILRQYGYGGELETIITSNASSDFGLSPIRMLVCQRGESAHYGKSFLMELASKHVSLMRYFEFTFAGFGWLDVVECFNSVGIRSTYVDITGDLHSDQNNVEYPFTYQSLYNWCDYLFVPILETAGPLSMLEAASCGKPIITSDVGFANYEIKPEYSYVPGNVDECCSILDKIYMERLIRSSSVDALSLSWEQYANSVVNFAVQVYEKRVANG